MGVSWPNCLRTRSQPRRPGKLNYMQTYIQQAALRATRRLGRQGAGPILAPSIASDADQKRTWGRQKKRETATSSSLTARRRTFAVDSPAHLLAVSDVRSLSGIDLLDDFIVLSFDDLSLQLLSWSKFIRFL